MRYFLLVSLIALFSGPANAQEAPGSKQQPAFESGFPEPTAQPAEAQAFESGFPAPEAVSGDPKQPELSAGK
jgi:hypothetical protein